MKKFNTFFTVLMTAMLSFSLVGCDEDEEIAYTLEGTWQGDMYVSYAYDGYIYDAAYSEICFLRDPYTYSSGQGYWVDYYSNAPWDYVANHIEWNVRNGIIQVYFVEDRSYVEIADYRLSDNYFTGTIYDGGSYVDFRLRHVSSPNWNDYDYGYDYWWGAKKNGNTRGFDSGTGGNEKPVRIFRTPDGNK